jgi:hypothetical protein
MKKTLPILMAAVFLVGMSMPVGAAEWSLFGQARVQTFWSDYSEERPAPFSDTTRFSGDRNRGTMQSSYSRFGGNVKHETIRGGFEVGSAGLTAINIRLLYGAVQLGGGELLVGQWYAPYGLGSLAVSKDVYNHHSGWGNMGTHFLGYTCRVPLVQYKMSGFTFAAIQPDATFSDTSIFADPERQIPQLQVAYDMAVDKMNFHIAGAYQTYKENAANAWNGERLDSWGVTANARFAQLNPLYVNIGGYYGQNVGPMGQYDGRAGFARNFYPNLSPTIVGGSVEDTDTYAGIIVIGYNGPISGEISVGHLVSDNDEWPTKDEMTHFYGQLRIPLTHAGHAMIVPQIGYYDYHDNYLGVDAGDTMYFGASWQIFF